MTSKLKQLKQDRDLLAVRLMKATSTIKAISNSFNSDRAPSDEQIQMLQKYVRSVEEYSELLLKLGAEIKYEETQMRPIGVSKGRSSRI